MSSQIKNVVYIVSSLSILLYLWLVYHNAILKFQYTEGYLYITNQTKLLLIRKELLTAYEIFDYLTELLMPVSILFPSVALLNVPLMCFSTIVNFIRPIRKYVINLRNYTYNHAHEQHAFTKMNARYPHVDDTFEILLFAALLLSLVYVCSSTSAVGMVIRTLFPKYIRSISEDQSENINIDDHVKSPEGEGLVVGGNKDDEKSRPSSLKKKKKNEKLKKVE